MLGNSYINEIKENNKYNVIRKDYVFFTCDLYANIEK